MSGRRNSYGAGQVGESHEETTSLARRRRVGGGAGEGYRNGSFAVARPILEAFCKTITHLGPTGAGQAAMAMGVADELARTLVDTGKIGADGCQKPDSAR